MKTKGISLLEIMLVIAISAVILIVAINYFTNVKMTNKINYSVMQVRNLYKGGIDYIYALRYQGMISGKVTNIQQVLLGGGYIAQSDLDSPWGTNQQNAVDRVISSSGNQLIVRLPTMPASACTAIVNRLKAPFPSPQTTYSCTPTAITGLTITFNLTIAG